MFHPELFYIFSHRAVVPGCIWSGLELSTSLASCSRCMEMQIWVQIWMIVSRWATENPQRLEKLDQIFSFCLPVSRLCISICCVPVLFGHIHPHKLIFSPHSVDNISMLLDISSSFTWTIQYTSWTLDRNIDLHFWMVEAWKQQIMSVHKHPSIEPRICFFAWNLWRASNVLTI
jgi:hypothetical protein